MALNKILSFFQFNEDDLDDDFEDEMDMEEEIAPRRHSRRVEEDIPERYTKAAVPERPEQMDRIDRMDRAERMSSRADRYDRSERNSDRASSRQSDYQSDYRNQKQSREKYNSKVVPIKAPRNGLEVTVTKPISFDDSQDICDLLIEGKAVIANLEGFDALEAQRVMDFISGCVYAMNGNLHQISKYIFIFSPENIDLSGDFLDTMTTQGFGVPTINHEF